MSGIIVQHADRVCRSRRTIFSVRPFHMSSPMALYCLLVVAMIVVLPKWALGRDGGGPWAPSFRPSFSQFLRVCQSKFMKNTESQPSFYVFVTRMSQNMTLTLVTLITHRHCTRVLVIGNRIGPCANTNPTETSFPCILLHLCHLSCSYEMWSMVSTADQERQHDCFHAPYPPTDIVPTQVSNTGSDALISIDHRFIQFRRGRTHAQRQPCIAFNIPSALVAVAQWCCQSRSAPPCGYY